MAKYFINDVEYANLTAARNDAKKLSKDGELIVIKNADATDKAWYQDGAEIDIVVEESVAEEVVEDTTTEEEGAVEEVTQEETVGEPVKEEVCEEPASNNIKYRVLLIDKLTGTKSCLVSPPAVGGYFKSEEEATKSAQNFIEVTKLANRFNFSVVPEERK